MRPLALATRRASGGGKRKNSRPVWSVFSASGPGGSRAIRIARLETSGFSFSSFNPAAALLGPLWAAGRALWTPFWIAAAVEAACFAGLVRSSWAGGSPEAPGAHGALLALCVVILLVARAAQGTLADWILWRAWQRWRHGERGSGRVRAANAALGALAAFGLIAISIWRYGIQAAPDFLRSFPAPRFIQRATAKGIDDVVDWMVVKFEAFFASITAGLREVLNLIEALFIGIPWPVAAVLIVALSWRAAGWRVGLFSLIALAYLGLFGYWEKSMSTLALVMASALLCIVIGTPIGIWCGKDAKVYAVVKPVLDFMQTMPSFVYLIPAVAFFSIGKPPGVFATVIFAMPPMIRLAALGIAQVPHDVREAALAFGTSPWQLLVKVELPLSAPSMLAGMNQTIMMSLSMVIIASMIGAGGLGYDVLIALRRLNTGEGMLAGTAIVVCAMILDRIVQGRRSRRRKGRPR